MRNPLYKRIPRDLKKNAIKYLGMIVILVCTISIGSSFQITLNGAVDYLDQIKEGNFQEDGFIEVTDPISSEIIDHLEEEGIWVEENFYATEHEFTDSSKVLLFNERNKMDIPVLFSGKLPEKENEIALDHVFARNTDIKIGESIILLGKEYYVCGTVSLPDYSALFMNNTDLVMNTNHFCVSVLSEKGFENIGSNALTYRYSYRYTDRDLSNKEKTDLAEDAYKYLLMNGVNVQIMLTNI